MLYIANTMKNPLDYKIENPVVFPTAFITYHPQTKTTKEHFAYNPKIMHILFPSPPHTKKKVPFSFDLSSLCMKWMDLLEASFSETANSGDGVGVSYQFIDVYQSQRRRYGVRGVILSDHISVPQKPKNHYLFVLERIVPERFNLSVMFQKWNLNLREQDIVRLLLEDQSNKEVAHTLGLTLNTVKGYMKLLMRKLGVSSRTGVITKLLIGRDE